jgi:esterase/lipase superfamily enzyme
MEGKLSVPIGHIILAAADLTTSLFKQYAQSYAALAKQRVTNYSYKADKALMASRKLHDQARVGLEPPLFICDGIDSISVSKLDLDLPGHGYISSASPLLYDMAQFIHDNKPPAQRTRLEPMPPGEQMYWLLAR